MALVSFALRKTTVGFGSSLRKSASDDNSLRADGLSTAGLQVIGNNEFSANIIDDGIVRLSWVLSENLVDESTITSGADPTQLVIVSSTRGEPVTINDGSIITRISYTTSQTFYDDIPAIQPGRWVYYTLFIRYSDGTDHWYESAGTLYIQIPIQYNSTDDLWMHIPEHYRSLDYEQPVLSQGKTPLYAFLDLIGDEVDRTRTLIETIALSNDPEIAVTPALAQLAYETGLEISLSDLGTAKVRNLIGSIGYLRQRKGTIGSIASYISALSGCAVEYEYKPSALKPHIFHVYAQRQNYVSDPRFSQATITTSTSTTGAIKYTLQTTTTWGVYTYGTASSGTDVTPVIENTNSGIKLTFPSGTWSTRKVLVYPRKSIPYVPSNAYECSFDSALSSGASFNLVHTSTNNTRLQWEAGVTGASAAPSPLYQDTSWVTSLSLTPTSTQQRYEVVYPANPSAGYSVITSVPVLEFDVTPGGSLFVGRWLWEQGSSSYYFDGDTREGGYIPVNTGAAGQGTFDYYWGPDGSGQSYSFYLMDHERVVKTVERVLAQYVIPVTMLDSYLIDWDYYPGKT